MKKLLLLFVLAFALFACNKSEESEEVMEQGSQGMPMDMNHGMGGGEAADSPAKVQIDGKTLKLANFTMEIPETWKSIAPASSMRLVQFAPDSDPSIEIIGFYFGNQENMVKANIDRWKGQFASVENFAEKTLNDEINFVKITGTFKNSDSPMDMASSFTEAPGYIMLAAILPSNEGPYFFKTVAPKDKMDAEEENFVNFLKSYKK